MLVPIIVSTVLRIRCERFTCHGSKPQHVTSDLQASIMGCGFTYSWDTPCCNCANASGTDPLGRPSCRLSTKLAMTPVSWSREPRHAC